MTDTASASTPAPSLGQHLLDSAARKQHAKDMTLDELFAIGNRDRDYNRASGMPTDGCDYLTETWLDALIDYCGVPVVVANALAARWCLSCRWEQPETPSA